MALACAPRWWLPCLHRGTGVLHWFENWKQIAQPTSLTYLLRTSSLAIFHLINDKFHPPNRVFKYQDLHCPPKWSQMNLAWLQPQSSVYLFWPPSRKCQFCPNKDIITLQIDEPQLLKRAVNSNSKNTRAFEIFENRPSLNYVIKRTGWVHRMAIPY